MRRRSRYSNNGYWPRYVPVSERRAQAEREIARLRKKNRDIQPVEIEGRTIARSFWGKGWCSHLESFGDYSNRLPRGRTYVRNGSVCHLGVGRGTVDALVAGSKLYKVRVDIVPLGKQKWKALKQQCTGRIGSLIELLQGNLSEEIMDRVTDRENGLFPLPGEIKYTCNCPDWADMCKHISAVMYGIGARLDARPELLFLLRGVDHEELITADVATDAIAGKGSRRARRKAFSESDVANVFGVELAAQQAEDEADKQAAPTRRRRAKRKTAKKKMVKKQNVSSKKEPFSPNAASVAGLRRRLGMSRAAFAQAVGVSSAAVRNWETADGHIKLHVKSVKGLNRLLAKESAV
jgi:uncharacterized Zn finger protein